MEALSFNLIKKNKTHQQFPGSLKYQHIWWQETLYWHLKKRVCILFHHQLP